MTRPQRYLWRMVLFLACVGGVGAVVFMPLRDAFLSNAPLNGLIVGVLILGILNNFRQVTLLSPEVRWIENFKTDKPVTSSDATPKLLAPMAAMLGERKESGRSLSLSAMSTRSLLDGIATRLEESRDLSRYNIGLLIFLGLLGTFWGLLETVGSIGNVIAGLNIGFGDLSNVFNDLKEGLKAPLDGMGTAFSSSLFGLAGSLVLGFLDLQTGQAQNRFYTDLEDWLSQVTRLSSGTIGGGDGDQSVPAYVQALLEQTADSLENLQRTMSRSEETKNSVNNALLGLTEKLGSLSDQMKMETQLMAKLAEGQLETKAIMERLASGAISNGGLDEVSRNHLRSLDVHAQRIVAEMASGREELIQQMRSEVKLLARTMAGLGDKIER